MSPRQVLIIGGGFGGLSAARVLSREAARLPGSADGPALQVTLLDRRNHHLFQPLLYQVATATLSPGDIASPIRWILRHAPHLRVLMGEAQSIDVLSRRVTLSDGGTLDYDYLIVATGASHSYFGHPEWERFAPGLKTLEDALEVRRRILLAFERAEREEDPRRRQELLTFVLVGGGPTGVELAGTLAEIARQTLRDEFRSIDTRQTHIVLVEGGPTILPAFPEKLRDAARASLTSLGVEVRERSIVTGIDEHGVLLGDERIAAGTLLWAAGVAACAVVRTMGVATDRSGRAIVEPDLTIPGHPEVFVVGDAAVVHRADGSQVPGVAQPAIQEARHAAQMVLRRMRDEPSEPFEYRDKGNLAIVGRGSAIADLNWLRFSGPLAWLAWLFLHIVLLIGFRNRLAVLLDWAAAYFTFQRSARLITNTRPADTPPEVGSSPR